MRRLPRLAVAFACVTLLAGCPSGELAAPRVGRPSTSTTLAPLPAPEVVALTGSMSDLGRRLFYETRPEILDRAELALECGEDEFGSVLGCYGEGRIAILRVTRPELAGVMEVTAAHELLHAVYEDLPSRERVRIDAAVAAAYARVADPFIRETVAEYQEQDPSTVGDELHSILGTEVAALDPVLTEHYGRFFSSRQRVLDANRGYLGAFEEVERRIDTLHAEADAIEAQLQALEAQIDADEAAVEKLDSRLDGLEAKGDARGFNRLLPEREALNRRLSERIDRYNALVDAYNAKAEVLDALALEQDQLVDGLEGKPPAAP